MEKSSHLLLTTLLLLVKFEHAELSNHNKTLLLNPSHLQEIFKDLEKLWMTEANDVLQPDPPVHGIHLKPSHASVGLVGQRSKIKIIPDESYSIVLDRKLIVTSSNRKIFRVLTKEIVLPGTVGNRSQGTRKSSGSGSDLDDRTGLNIVLFGLKPGRAQLNIQVI